MATESPLANLYNDQAPLEHHHLAIMFQILRREGCDILGHLEKPQRTRIREVMIQGILATEMSEHGTHITKVPGAESAALGLADSDRLAVASALLHAADLSSPGRPFATCKVWVLRLLEEFKFQAEQVRACLCSCVCL
ncbi:unnamed protein product [Ectocarpus sp. 12 AP-2014]